MTSALEKLPNNEWSRQHAAHLLKLTSFSGTATEIDECFHLGLEKSVNFILSGKQPGAPLEPIRKAINPKSLSDIPVLPHEKHNSNRDDDAPYLRYQKKLFSLQKEWLQRMLDSGGPLEKMALFWHGMLTSSYNKVKSAAFIARQNQLFRKIAFGDYRSLVKQIILDPAMIVYLDLDKNTRSFSNPYLEARKSATP